ncbi:MAG: hypothetical protein AAGC55_05205, partial [Myxococcota bacterium]
MTWQRILSICVAVSALAVPVHAQPADPPPSADAPAPAETPAPPTETPIPPAATPAPAETPAPAAVPAPPAAASVVPAEPDPLPGPARAASVAADELPGSVLPVAARQAMERIIHPYLVIAGGMRFEDIVKREGQTSQQRSPTVAVSRVGVRGRLGPHIRFVSAFEANIGGSLGYGASVWEGQAQMSVLDQFVEYERSGLSVAAGRITDLATTDFYSAHVADLLYTDAYTRDPLLLSGTNRGTGLAVGYRFRPELRAGLSVHSTNPTGITGTLLIGGPLPPFDRPFSLAASQVGRNEFTLPDQSLHIYFVTPSLVYEDEVFAAKAAVQAYQLDTDMARSDDQRIYGYNLRVSLRAKLLDGRLALFANGSRNENEILDSMDVSIKRVETYQSYTFGGGVDVNYAGDNGIGVQYVQVREDLGMDNSGTVDHYVNIGTTYWIQDGLSVGLRYGMFLRLDDA